MYFSAFGVYWSVTGVPSPPMAGILESIFSGVLPARSLRNKDLEVKSLFFFQLGTFRRRFGLRAGHLCLLPALDPHFIPIKKSSLTKVGPREGAFSCVMAFWAMTRVGTPRPYKK